MYILSNYCFRFSSEKYPKVELLSHRVILFLIFWSTSLVAQTVKSLPAARETQVWSLFWEDPLEKETATHYSCLESPMDGGVWQALSSPWSCKELDMTEWLHFPYCFPRWLPVYIPTNSSIECPFLIITNTCYLLFFDNSHSYRYEIPHCGFDLYFPMISDVEHLFMCLLATVYCLSENAHFKNQVVYNFDRVVWVLCIFWVLAPYWIYHLQISSPVQ